jgi:ribosomal-protein-alanine N-acetyltransferase
MTDADLERVLEIERGSFRSPWSRQAFESELRKPYGMPFVYDDGGLVAGYCIAWKVADEMHVANLAVDPARRRRRIAETLLRSLLETAPECTWIGLEVRRSNDAARTLYRKLGFIDAGVRKGYYVDANEDAILMVKSIHPLHPR